MSSQVSFTPLDYAPADVEEVPVKSTLPSTEVCTVVVRRNFGPVHELRISSLDPSICGYRADISYLNKAETERKLTVTLLASGRGGFYFPLVIREPQVKRVTVTLTATRQ